MKSLMEKMANSVFARIHHLLREEEAGGAFLFLSVQD